MESKARRSSSAGPIYGVAPKQRMDHGRYGDCKRRYDGAAIKEEKMPRILLVVDRVDTFEELAEALQHEGAAEIMWAHSSETALEKAAAEAPDLVIVDAYIGELNGLDWIRRLISVNAFIQTAAVSRLTHEVFHETAEGLGIMAQLPPRPGKTDARRVLEMINKFSNLEK
jgi:CheY-like chemotaxis protein